MMTLKTRVTYYNSIGAKQRAINNCLRDALKIDVAEFWVTNKAPAHFDDGAEQKYQMVPRSKSYLRRRAGMARKLGIRPGALKFTGTLAREVVAGGIAGWTKRAWATSTRQRLRLSRKLPHYMWGIHALEVTAINQREHAELKRVLTQGFERRMAGVQVREVVIISA